MKTCPHCHKSLLVYCGLCACGCGKQVWVHPIVAARRSNGPRFASKKCANGWNYQARALAWVAEQKAQRGKVA